MSIERQFHVFAKAVEEMRQAQRDWLVDGHNFNGEAFLKMSDCQARVDRLLRKLLHPMDSD